MVEARALQTMKDGKLECCCGFELDVKRFLHTWLASQRALLRTKTYDLKTWLFSVFIKGKLLIIKTILYDFWPKWGPKTRFLQMKNCLTLITYDVNFCKRNILTIAIFIQNVCLELINSTNSCWKKLEEKHTRFQAHFRFLGGSGFCVRSLEEYFRGRTAGSFPEFRVASVLLLMF